MRGPRFEAEQEIRFAVVLYGGVSLAIYINGVVQELLRLVRATAPALPVSELEGPQDTWYADERLRGSERVYRQVGQMLPADGGTTAPPEASVAAAA